MKILVTAIGSMSAPAVINALKQAGHTVIGCDINPKSWMWASELVHEFYQAPHITSVEAYLDFVIRLCQQNNLDIILPITDVEVEVLSANRHIFPKSVTLAIAGHQAVMIARDKLRWSHLLSPHLSTIPSCNLKDFIAERWAYPLFLKPAKGRSSEGTKRINSSQELAFWQEHAESGDIIVQPFISGEIYVVDIVRDAKRQQSVAIVRKELLRTVNGAGLTVEICIQPKLEELANQVACLIDLTGCINIEFMHLDNTFFLMDINPRFSAGVEFSMLAGYDMVINHLRCFSTEPLAPAVAVMPNIYSRHYVATKNVIGDEHE